eukprot:TRINITY_DN13780_c1_g1_i1.p1 TRINITY_DN13780_c1_g1~~TRINITY_DN13780_c1_g1_i1.p1  ORF type:complete len:1125 (+),score=302.03 TRINITY_DN13780_c1_g1_i1:80-3454(+)
MGDEEDQPQGEEDMDGLDGLEEEEDDEELDDEEEEDEEQKELADTTAIREVQDKTFEEVKLPADVVAEVQQTWATFISISGSREAAGQALYMSLFDSAPSLQSLFKTARAIAAMRILNGVSAVIGYMSQPSALKVTTETLGFQHLDLEVTVPRVVIFRDAIIDMLEMELGPQLTSKAKSGWRSILNYVGGAFIYVRVNFSERLKIIASSWATANNKAAELENTSGEGESKHGEEGEGDGEEGDAEGEGEGEDEGEQNGMGGEGDMKANERKEGRADYGKGKGKGKGFKGKGKGESGEAAEGTKKSTMKVPTTFNEMFLFNGAVMGFGSSLWMSEILEVFEDIVQNISNSYRLQEACDTLSLSLAKYKGTINLAEFKAVMLASLRSLCPAEWGSQHEVAWSWLWENVERMLKAQMGKPKVQAKSLERFIMSLTEDSVNYLRRELYKSFFALAPAGQDFFKQSTTRLYWIADKVVEMTIEMYRDPKKKVDELSALGLRHVGYGVLTEFFAPYVTGAVQTVQKMTNDTNAQDGFQWSLGLMSRILVRTINEGSTVVMKAVNANSEKSLRKAVSIAPRGKRAMWMLNITVGTQSISPLFWAIESGSLHTAKAMIADLLVIRADRDNYYYGCMDLFERHPDVIHRLSIDAPALLPTLFDGLIWRSRVAQNGQRRVNYYVKYLVQDMEGQFNQALEWIVDGKDPKIICHPVVVLFSDLIWNHLANRSFLVGRVYFFFTLVVFILGQSILPALNGNEESPAERIATFACRCIIYLVSMGQLLWSQIKHLYNDIRKRHFVTVMHVKVPEYLLSFHELQCLSLVTCLICMCTQEPIWHCLGDTVGDLFTQNCPEAESHKEAYATLSMLSMLLYWMLMMDLTILSMQLSAYVLVCMRVLDEVGLFLLALSFLVTSFASAISTLDHGSEVFEGVPEGMKTLIQIGLRMFPSEEFSSLHAEPTLHAAVSLFIIVAVIFLLNLLIAQLNGAYSAVYEDMLGYARLNRGDVIVTTMEGISQKRWKKVLEWLNFDARLEFNEGDVGVAGGIQVLEPSNLNPTTIDMITRFGGSTSASMPWPEEETTILDDEDKMDRLEKSMSKVTKKIGGIAEGGAGAKKKGGGSSGGGSGAGSSFGSE